MKLRYSQILKFLLLFAIVLMTACKDKTPLKKAQQEDITIDTTTKRLPKMYAQTSSFLTQQHTDLGGMVRQFVRVMYQDTKGNIWFGSNGDGLFRYDGKTLEPFPDHPYFKNDAIREIVEDGEGNVWFGSGHGLSRYDGKEFTNFTEDNGAPTQEIWGLTIDRSGMIWMGTVAGLYQFDGTTFTPFSIPKPKIQNPKSILSPDRISKIMEDRNGNLWFLRDGYGITIYNGTDFTHFTTENGLPDNNVADLLEDKNGNIWIGTFYGGLSMYDGKTFTNFTEQGIIKGEEVYNLIEDREGNIWFSVENVGVYRYDGTDFSLFNTDDGLVSNGVQSIFEDQKGQIWFGTWSGLSMFDGKAFVNATEKEPWAK